MLVNIMMFVTMYPVVLIMYFLFCRQYQYTNGCLFAVNMKPEWIKEPKVQAIVEKFQTEMKKYVIILMLVPFTSFFTKYMSIQLTIWVMWILLVIGLLCLPLQIRRSIRQLYSQPRKGRPDNFHQKIARLRERADELEMRIRHALFDQSRVIACTLTGAANQLLVGQHYHTLFIDEAAQALEAACWIPLQKADRVIFAGDHQQLPPTIKCQEAMRGGLGRTLMEQVAERKPEVVRLLRVQYRMNESLMRFSSEWFYGGQLEAAPEVRHRSLLDDIDDPLVWIDTPSEAAEQFVGSNYGRINKTEAALTLQALHDYVERMGRTRLVNERTDFGIISPYRAQVQYLRGLIKRDDYLRPLRKLITVNTVDAFQGQERPAVSAIIPSSSKRLVR